MNDQEEQEAIEVRDLADVATAYRDHGPGVKVKNVGGGDITAKLDSGRTFRLAKGRTRQLVEHEKDGLPA